MNIGFDLDKIFIDYPPLIPDKFINKLYKQKSNGMLLYRMPSKGERFIRIVSHYPMFRPPIIENIQFVEFLAKRKKHRYYLISSRFSFLKRQTEFIVKKYNFDKIFAEMFFNFKDQQPHIFKNHVIEKMKIDLYVDDDLQLLEYLANKNTKIKFFWINVMQHKPLRKNLFAIRHLSEIFTCSPSRSRSATPRRWPKGLLRGEPT